MQDDYRRTFLKQLALLTAGTAAASCGGGGSDAAPAPDPVAGTPPATTPPAPAPGTGSPATEPPAVAGPLPAFALSSTAGADLAAFCLGQAFRQGDVPSGRGIGCELPNFQATVLNRWPDGSAKFAVLAGRASVGANGSRKVQLTLTNPAAAGAAVSETQLKNTGVTAALGFSGAGSVELQSLIGVESTYDPAKRRWSAGRVRQWIAGSEMSSWIYSAPVGTNAHLTAWFEVRCWANGQVQILPWVENGYLNVAGPTTQAGQLSFALNGNERFSAAVSLTHHSRTAALRGTALSYWSPAEPDLLAAQDTAYLQRSRLVPNYRSRPGAAVVNKYPVAYEPLTRATFPTSMGDAGYDPSIGLLPEWDVSFLTSSAAPRAHATVLLHGLAAGRYAIHYRDETTNQPLRFSSYPDLCLDDSGFVGVTGLGRSTANRYTPPVSGSAPPVWVNSHHPSIGYLAYLVSGWFYFAEETQFAATLTYLKQGNAGRANAKGVFLPNAGANTTRGAAWALRTLAQATTVTPDADTALRGEFLNSIAANIDDNHARFIATPNNPQGVCTPYSDYTEKDGKYMHSMWMEDFLTAAWGYILALKPGLSTASQDKLRAFFEWKARSIVGRLGRPGVATEFNFCDAAQYIVAVAPSDTPDFNGGKGPWYADWGQVYQATLGQANATAGGNQLRGAYFPTAISYWGNLQPAIAYAVEHGATGALEAYRRMTGASNWPQFVADLNTNPVWGVEPLSTP